MGGPAHQFLIFIPLRRSPGQVFLISVLLQRSPRQVFLISVPLRRSPRQVFLISVLLQRSPRQVFLISVPLQRSPRQVFLISVPLRRSLGANRMSGCLFEKRHTGARRLRCPSIGRSKSGESCNPSTRIHQIVHEQYARQAISNRLNARHAVITRITVGFVPERDDGNARRQFVPTNCACSPALGGRRRGL